MEDRGGARIPSSHVAEGVRSTVTSAPASSRVLRPLLQAIRDQYALPWWGLHGVPHWARVYENALRLLDRTRADREVLLYFALFHDAMRVNESWDEGHGRRGAEFAASLRGSYFDLTSHQFELLFFACAQHTEGLVEADPTVQICWDADRLDLARARILPHPDHLCCPTARQPEVIAWATDRSLRHWIPSIVQEAWATQGPGPETVDRSKGQQA